MRYLAGYTRVHVSGGSTKFVAELKPGDVLADGTKVTSLKYIQEPTHVKEIRPGIFVASISEGVLADSIFEVDAGDGSIPLVDDMDDVYPV